VTNYIAHVTFREKLFQTQLFPILYGHHRLLTQSVKMIWTTIKFKEILESSLPQYLNSSGDDRKALLKDVSRQIRNHGEKSGEQVPADLKQVRIAIIRSIPLPNSFLLSESFKLVSKS
jgi:hypothetical protein